LLMRTLAAISSFPCKDPPAGEATTWLSDR